MSGKDATAEEVKNLVLDKGLGHLRIHRHCFIGCVERCTGGLIIFQMSCLGLLHKAWGNLTCAPLSRLGLNRT